MEDYKDLRLKRIELKEREVKALESIAESLNQIRYGEAKINIIQRYQ